MKFSHLLKEHYFAVVLAISLGVLMILPFFYFRVKLGSDFHGVLPTAVNDVMFYYARINDAAGGHSFLNNAYLFEHKSGLPQQLFLAEWLLAQPIKIFNLNINTARFIYNFLLPAIAFILTYLALCLISKSRLWSIIFSVFLFFGLYLLAFTRPVSPQFNFIFWLTQFIFLWRLLENPDSKKWLLANIVNFSLLFYVYPYYWTFYLIFFGVLLAAYFWKNRELAVKISAIAAGGLMLAIPYFYLNYLASHLPYYTETLTRLGMIYSHFPSGARIIVYTIFGLILFGLALWKKIINFDTKTVFFTSGILASVIAVNQHLITGRNIEFSSHYDMAAMFFLVFAASYLISQYSVNKFVLLRQICILGLLALTVFYGLRDYSERVFAIDENAAYRQNYAPIFEWLNKNAEKDSVVYANVDLSGLIPVYTANNVFYIREANLFFISDEEVLDRFILNNFFEKFDRDFVIKNARPIYGVRYIDKYGHAVQGNKLRRILGLKTDPEIYLPEEAILKVMARAKELQKGDFIEELGKFRVDYLVWDKNKNPNWKINLENFNPVFQNDGLIIFKLVF